MPDTTNNITTVFSADISNFSKSTQDLNRYISTVNAEFKNATAGMDDWSKSTDGLEAKLKQLNGVLDAQKKKLASTQDEYDALVKAGKGNTAEAQKLYISLQKQSAEVKKTEKAISDYTDELEQMEKGSKDAEKSTSSLAKSLGSAAKGALTAIVASAGAAVGSFLALAESTRELRTEMGKLETAYTTAGHSAETAEKTYKTLYGVLGDSGKATEAAQQLAKIAKSEDELAGLTNTLTGVYAVFGDSLPVEALAETINSSSKIGVVQGNLADALEWSGVNLDDFNANLATMNTEEERSAYITETLNGLYGEAATKYKEVNKDVIAANEAQANLNQSMADLGAVAEPIVTILKNIGATILTGLLPYIQQLAGVMTSFLSGDMTAGAEGLQTFFDGLAPKLETLLNNVLSKVIEFIPQLLTIVGSIIEQLLPVLVNIITLILQKVGELAPQLLPQIVGLLSTIIQNVVKYIPTLLDAAGKLLIQIVKAIPPTISKLIQELPNIITSILSAISGARGSLAQTAMSLFFEIVKAIPQIALDLIKNMPQIISAIVKGLANGYKEMFNIGRDMLKGLWEGMKSLGDWIWSKIKGFFNDTLVGGIKKLLGIHSPSKVFAELGEYSGEGFVEGLAGSIKGANNVLRADDYTGIVGGAGGGGTVNNRTSNVTVYQTFEKMPTSKYALHQAKIEMLNAQKVYAGV